MMLRELIVVSDGGCISIDIDKFYPRLIVLFSSLLSGRRATVLKIDILNSYAFLRFSVSPCLVWLAIKL
jgi:hypothetical protein